MTTMSSTLSGNTSGTINIPDYSADIGRIATALETIADNLGITPIVSLLQSSSISSSGVLTVGTGTPAIGMLLSGPGIQTAQLITPTTVSLLNDVATLTYSPQTVIPFIVGQFITVTGVTPAVINGSWVVTSVSQTDVSFALTHPNILVTNTIGTIISTPVIVTSHTGGIIWQTNQTAMVAVPSTTVTGTITSTLVSNINSITSSSRQLSDLATTSGIHTVGPWEWLGLSSIVKYYQDNGIDPATLKASVDALPKSF